MSKENTENEFISTVSHEIRTPLTSIKGFAKTMFDNWEALNEEDKKRFLKIILEQSDRLINLVENVLSAAKINNTEIVLKEINLPSLIKSVVDILKINYKDINFTISDVSKINSLADKDKLEQVLLNVMENACKYSSKNPDGTIPPVEINIQTKGNCNIVSVKNFNSCIPENEAKHIFEKFYRIDNYLTSSAQGSGLGLYIAKNLIEKMDGKIELYSDKNPVPFVEFQITIPVMDTEKMVKKIGGKNV